MRVNTVVERSEDKRGHWLLDIGVITTVIVVLIGVYLFPASIQRALVFEYTEPTLLTAYTAHFVHFSVRHFIGNLTAFVLVSGTVYVISVEANRRRAFVKICATILIAFPIALSMLNLSIPRNSITYGFSGMNMAFVGFLPIVLTTYIERQWRYSLDTKILLLAFVLSVSYIAAVVLPNERFFGITVWIALVVALGILTVSFLLHAISERPANASRSRRVTRMSRFERIASNGPAAIPLVFGTALWVLFLSIGFTTPDATTGTVTNVYTHFLGYALGFITAYLAYEWRLFDEQPVRTATCSREKAQSDAN